MKLIIIISACLASIVNGAEQLRDRPSLPKEYALRNKYQIECFSHWLKKHDIPIEGKAIISFDCYTGELEDILAEKAKRVHGISPSRKMIDYAHKTHAQETHTQKTNLSFAHCFPEDFSSPTSYDLAIASSCFQFFEDKPKAIHAIANSLKSNGLFFANIETQDNSKPLGIAVFEEMKCDVPIIGTLLAMLPNPTGSSQPTYGELHVWLTEAGFTNIKPKIESYDWTMTAEEWRKIQLPLLLSTPGAQILVNSTSDNWYAKKASEGAFWWITMSLKEKEEHDAPFFPESNHELIQKIRTNDFCRYLFNNFLRRYLDKLQNNGDGTYTWKYKTTIILAQKK